MLGNGLDLAPPCHRKHDETTPKQGPIGRAVRKLTPRKSSFVNLLKGKGWNAGKEDGKMNEGTTEDVMPSAKNSDPFEGKAE
jgi:hypothetical protein